MADYFIHKSSYIDTNVSIGTGTKIWHFSHIMSGAIIGKNCVLGQNVFVGSYVVIGNNCKIQNNVSIYESVELEDDVFCGPSVVFTNVIYPRSFIDRKNQFQKTLLKKGCSIGANSTIICGNKIGEYSLIGAGTVITKDVPDYAMVTGTAGLRSGWVCRCGVPLKDIMDKPILSCICGNKYGIKNQQLYPID